MCKNKTTFILLFLLGIIVSKTTAFGEDAKMEDLLKMKPEDFFNLDIYVISPAKKIQKLKNVPSAMYVLTAEDIRRSAATNFIDLLRLVPGLHVARVNSNQWAISSRGLSQVFSNNILLLIDGIPAESQLFNGIFWENFLNIPLNNIHRVEVVKGPGTAVWGTRAVQGLINVITKKATEEENEVQVGGGNEHTANAYAKVGKKIGKKSALYTTVTYDKLDTSKKHSGGGQLDDAWEIAGLDFRGDFRIDVLNSLRITSRLSTKRSHWETDVPSLASPYATRRHDSRKHKKGSFAALWTRAIGHEEISLETTASYEHRDDFTFDIHDFVSDTEFRHRFRFFEQSIINDFTYGLNFRSTTDRTDGTKYLSFEPENRSIEFYRGFISDEISLIPTVLRLTLGSRFEQNTQDNFHALPTARISWKANPGLSLWAAYSHTIGMPSRVNDDIRAPAAAFLDEKTGLPTLITVHGNRDLKPEKANVWEIGLWAEPIREIYLSTTGFYSRRGNIITREVGTPEVANDPIYGPFISVPMSYDDQLKADTLGTEIALDWVLSNRFSMAATYAFLYTDADPSESSRDVIKANAIENIARHSATLRTHFDFIHKKFETDLIIRYVDGFSRSNFDIDSYVEGDLQFRWFITPKFNIRLVGRNLFNSSHEELKAVVFKTPFSDVERSFFLQASYGF